MAKVIYEPLRYSHYSAVKHTYSDDDGKQHTTFVMALVHDSTGAAIDFPGLEVFCAPYTGRVPVYNKKLVRSGLCYVAHALNYIFKEHYWEYGITSLAEVTDNILFDVFDDYAYTKYRGRYRSQQAIDTFVSTVTMFFANLSVSCPDCKIQASEILTEVKVLKRKKPGDLKLVYLPIYRAKTQADCESALERDIPTAVVDLLVSLAELYDPMLVFALQTMRYTGMRIGEVLSMRQAQSPVGPGPGISFRRRGNTVIGVEIDVRHEYELRADGKATGGIKRERTVSLYKPYIQNFMTAYEYHMDILNHTKFDKNYCPMFVDSKGNAMLKTTFYKRFIRLVNDRLIPALLESNDPTLVEYGTDLQFRNLRPHVLRHFFTVNLVCEGLSCEAIASLRGDRSTDTAMIYLRNKGALMNRLESVHDLLIEELAKEADSAIK